MKVIASLTASGNASPTDFGPLEGPESNRVWELYEEGTLREIYLRTDAIGAVIVLEVADEAEAARAIRSLPMVEAGLFEIGYVPLAPWPEMTRMLEERGQPVILARSAARRSRPRGGR